MQASPYSLDSVCAGVSELMPVVEQTASPSARRAFENRVKMPFAFCGHPLNDSAAKRAPLWDSLVLLSDGSGYVSVTGFEAPQQIWIARNLHS